MNPYDYDECVYTPIHIDPNSGAKDRITIYGVQDVWLNQTDFDNFDPMDGVYAQTQKGETVPVTATPDTATTTLKTYSYLATKDDVTASAYRNVRLWGNPTLTLQDQTITRWDAFDPRTMIVSATAFDGADIKPAVTYAGTYDPNTAGTYSVTFTANSHGFITTDTAVLTVLPWENPVITAPALTSIVVGDVFDPIAGVSAVDYAGNNLTSAVTYTSNVNTDAMGTYTVAYSVTDSRGRTGTATQTVEVGASPYATYLFPDGALVINALKTDLPALEAIHGTKRNEYNPGPYTNVTYNSDIPWYNQRTQVKSAEFGSAFAPPTVKYLFGGLTNLESVDLTNLNSSNCTNFSNMFYDCQKLKVIDATKINVDNATTLDRMFLNCWVLNVLDLTDWDTSNCTNFHDMFFSCVDLATIYASPAFVVPAGSDTIHMFANCNDIAGGMGTQWDSTKTDGERAVIDEGVGQVGYFTDKTKMVTTLYADGRLVINESPAHRASNMATHGKILRQYAPTLAANNWEHGWNDNTSVRTVEFDTAVAPTNTRQWFDGCTRLTSVDFTNLDTSNNTDMTGMFHHCDVLATADFSILDTSNVTKMNGLFQNCHAMTAQMLTDINAWDTSSVTDMSAMFSGNTSYPDIKLTFDTSNVTRMNTMFGYSNGFRTIDISAFDTSNVVDTAFMFGICPNLTTIYTDCPVTWGAGAMMNNMFYNSTHLVGGAGTTYSVPGGAYAKCDGGTADPGYFTKFIPPYGTYLYPNGRLIINEKQSDHAANVQAYGLPIGTYDAWDPVTNPYHFNGYFETPWTSDNDKITQVVIGSPMKPDRMDYWFSELPFATMVSTGTLLDTSECTSMDSVFAGSSSIIGTLDLRHWNVENVTSMNHMFSTTSSLDYIDLRGWNVSSVTDMSCMFEQTALKEMPRISSSWDTANVTDFSSLFSGSTMTSIDMTGWNTANATDISRMFLDCGDLQSVILPIDTSSATQMEYMFNGCHLLTELDLTSFSSASSPDMTSMFFGCESLQTIYATGDFDGAASPGWPFTDNTSLVGGEGTSYSDSHKGGDYAHCDGGTANPGYFTCDNGLYGTVIYSDGTLILNERKEDHDTNAALHGSMLGQLNAMDGAHPYIFPGQYDAPWYQYHDNITRIEIGDDMAPTDMTFWFNGLQEVTSISGLDKIDTSNCTSLKWTFSNFGRATNPISLDLSSWDTSNVTNMFGTFTNCACADNIDVSTWDTSNVTDMSWMFSNTENLGMISLLNFDTSNVTNMEKMFSRSGIVGAPLANFNTANVTNMKDMFTNCPALRGVDMRGWDTSNVTTMYGMFSQSSAIQIIQASSSFVAAGNTDYMFSGCISLVGGNGTAYDYRKTNGEYARLDDPPTSPGYFTA